MNHQKRNERKIHPISKSNLLPSLLFLYTLPLFKLGWKTGVKDDDLYDVLAKFQSKVLFGHLIKHWNLLKSRKQQSVWWLLWNSYGVYYLILGTVKFLVNTFLLFFQPYAISNIVSYFVPNQTEISKTEVYVFAGALILVKLINAIYEHNNKLWIATLGIRMRSSLFCFVYRKILKIDYAKVDNVEVGKIITMITKDIQSFENFLTFGNDIWSSVITTGFGCILLYRKIGTAALAGIGVLLAVIPFQVYAGVKIAFLERNMCERTEKRYKLVREAVSAIKLIKLYTWENLFKEKITAARKKEIWNIFFIQVTHSSIIDLSIFCMHIAQYVLLLTYTKLGNRINAQMVFFMVISFRLIKENFTIRFPLALNSFGKLFACVKRVDKLLKLPEIVKKTTKRLSSAIEISIENHKILGSLNLKLENESFMVITGPTNAGKTTFLKFILEECGNLETEERISYAPQEPWLFPSTIRQNILFGEKYNDNRYQEVLRICALNYDCVTFENGDFTVVEDGGLNLSKGQRARINLARAVYKNSDIYLFDDCLTSLDAITRSYIFKECICKFLQKKTVVLVSHNIDDFEYADKVVKLEDGLLKLVKKARTTVNLTTEICNQTRKIISNDNNKLFVEHGNETTKLLNEIPQRKIYNEYVKSEKVAKTVYVKYIKCGGGFLTFTLLMLVFMAVQAVKSVNDTILRNWVDLEQQISKISLNATLKIIHSAEERNDIIFKYTVVIILLLIATLSRVLLFFLFTTNASIHLHKKILNILEASMEFFNRNFVGNIVNRFSKDFAIIDEIIPPYFFVFITEFMQIVASLIIVTMANKVFLVLSVIFFIFLTTLRWFYLKTSRSLQRLNVATRSPVVGYINSTLDGISTIRAFNVQNILISEFDEHMNHFTSVSYIFQSSTFAFTLVLELLSVLFTSTILIKFLIFDDGRTTAGAVGLVLSQASLLIYIIKLGIWRWADMENNMTSVERVLEYSDTNLESKVGIDKENWPNNGEIKFEKVCLTYPDTICPILKNVSFTVAAKEKLGIVGRTGAGKSTIFSALCRLYDIEGKIFIGGIDIKTISLKQLRSNVTVITQDFAFFTGSVRDNIDPQRQCSDEELWKIIDSTNLRCVITNLDEEVVDKEALYSAGQKQLFCMARALARKNKIILLDEATANLDSENATLIQETIQKNFDSCTVLLITHTLRSILNCDRVLVLDNGVIAEIGIPKNLLKNNKGVLFKMCQEAKFSPLV